MSESSGFANVEVHRRGAADEGVDMQAVWSALDGLFPDDHMALVRLAGGRRDPDILATIHHEVEGLIRTMRYLGDKVTAAYDPSDLAGRKVIQSIDRHLNSLKGLREHLLDPVFAQATCDPGDAQE